MPLPIPSRYSLEVRIGNDDDIEEWLATDADLDRPVLVRMLGSQSGPERRAEFLNAVRGAAGVTHPNMAQVFSAREIAEGVYSISEWPGGIRLSDRSAADLTLDPIAAIANAEGLARALASLHDSGQTHGAIDASAVFYGPGRPAKLGAFGRRRVTLGAKADVVSLAGMLDTALTGRPPGSVPPSEVVDGLSPSFDHAINLAWRGEASAEQFASLLTSVPSARTDNSSSPQVVTPWIKLVFGLLALATILIFIGSGLSSGPAFVPSGASATSPFNPAPTSTQPSSDQPTPTTTAQNSVTILSVEALDPLGDRQEHPELVSNLTDGDISTVWRTESYRDPLPLIKAGVGLVLHVSGTPNELVITSSSRGTQFKIYWSDSKSDSLSEWTLISTEGISEFVDVTAIPQRNGGFWLIWLTDLPAVANDFATEIAEVELR